MTDAPTIATHIDRAKHDEMVRLLAGGPEERAVVGDEAEKALSAHLGDMLQAAVLTTFDDLPNRRINEVHDWNAMTGADGADMQAKDRSIQDVAQRWAHGLIVYPMYRTAWGMRDGKSLGDDGMAAAYAAFVEEVDAGNVPWHRMGMETKDHVTGQRLNLEMRGWSLAFGARVPGIREHVAVADAEPPSIKTIEVDLPTGDLAIGDWFRPDGFTDLVDDGMRWRGGSRDENEAETVRYATAFGFVSVATGPRSVRVVRQGDRVVVAEHDETATPAGYEQVGSMVVDVRLISVIDAAVLLDILERIHPADVATRLVAETLEAAAVRLQVTPGRYRLSYTGDTSLADLLERDDPLLDGGSRPILLLERVANE